MFRRALIVAASFGLLFSSASLGQTPPHLWHQRFGDDTTHVADGVALAVGLCGTLPVCDLALGEEAKAPPMIVSALDSASGDTTRASVSTDTLALLHMWRLCKGKPNKGILGVLKFNDVTTREAAAAEYLKSQADKQRAMRVASGLLIICGGVLTAIEPTAEVVSEPHVTPWGEVVYTFRTVHEVQTWQLWAGGVEIVAGVVVLAMKFHTEREYEAYKREKEDSSVRTLSFSAGPGRGGRPRAMIVAAFSF